MFFFCSTKQAKLCQKNFFKMDSKAYVRTCIHRNVTSMHERLFCSYFLWKSGWQLMGVVSDVLFHRVLFRKCGKISEKLGKMRIFPEIFYQWDQREILFDNKRSAGCHVECRLGKWLATIFACVCDTKLHGIPGVATSDSGSCRWEDAILYWKAVRDGNRAIKESGKRPVSWKWVKLNEI